MKKDVKVLALDFGASSGRAIIGSFDGEKISLKEIHRFTNDPVILLDTMYWDVLRLFHDIKIGLIKAKQEGEIKSLGIDTWGVDFGLIDKNGNLLGNPVCYRDGRTDGMPGKVFGLINQSEHYSVSGTQVMDINSLFQLYAMKEEASPLLDVADKLLFMPDLFSYFLTGVANNEYSIASTSELMDIKARKWNYELIRQLGLPERIFCDIVMPGQERGMLKPEI